MRPEQMICELARWLYEHPEHYLVLRAEDEQDVFNRFHPSVKLVVRDASGACVCGRYANGDTIERAMVIGLPKFLEDLHAVEKAV